MLSPAVIWTAGKSQPPGVQHSVLSKSLSVCLWEAVFPDRRPGWFLHTQFGNLLSSPTGKEYTTEGGEESGLGHRLSAVLPVGYSGRPHERQRRFSVDWTQESTRVLATVLSDRKQLPSRVPARQKAKPSLISSYWAVPSGGDMIKTAVFRVTLSGFVFPWT